MDNSLDRDLNYVYWLFWAELARHGQEPLVLEELRRQADSNSEFHVPAQMALVVIGEDPQTMLARLKATIESGSVEDRHNATELMCGVVTHSDLSTYVPDMLEWCRADNDDVRSIALRAICRFPFAQGAKQALVESCNDPNPEVRKWAAEAIGAVARDNPSCFHVSEVRSLVNTLLNDDYFRVRQAGCYLASLYSWDDAVFLALIRQALCDEDPKVRCIALLDIDRGWGRPLAAAAMQEALGDADPSVRQRAESILRTHRAEKLRSLVPPLAIGLSSLVAVCVLAVCYRLTRRRKKRSGQV